jgi:hypothetical protein
MHISAFRGENSRIGAFAVIVLGVAGIMRIFDAIWAFRYHGVLPGKLEGGIFGHSLETYGWIYLIVAAVLIACAFLVLSGSQVAGGSELPTARSGPSALSGGCPTTRSGR